MHMFLQKILPMLYQPLVVHKPTMAKEMVYQMEANHSQYRVILSVLDPQKLKDQMKGFLNNSMMYPGSPFKKQHLVHCLLSYNQQKKTPLLKTPKKKRGALKESGSWLMLKTLNLKQASKAKLMEVASKMMMSQMLTKVKLSLQKSQILSPQSH